MIVYYLLLPHCLSLWYSTTFYWLPAYIYGTLLPSTGPLHIPMVIYYHLLTHCLYLWYSTIFYWPLPIPMELYYLLLAPGISICYSTIFYWIPAFIYDTILLSTGSLTILMVLYYFLLAYCLLYNPLLVPCLSL